SGRQLHRDVLRHRLLRQSPTVFEGFSLTTIDIGEVSIRARIGGQGPPVLLLHGNPQTHVMWHAVAPALSAHFTVVAADLTGYGMSSKPPSTPDHARYSKRAMARDQLALMRKLGFERFSVAGHDRGRTRRLSDGARLSRSCCQARGDGYRPHRRGIRPRRPRLWTGLLPLVLPCATSATARAPDRRGPRLVLALAHLAQLPRDVRTGGARGLSRLLSQSGDGTRNL